MPIQAQLADGRILEFPDDTDPAVIQSTVKRLIGQPEEPGFAQRAGAALKRGVEQIPESLQGIALGAEAAVGSAQKRFQDIKAAPQEKGIAPITYEELEKTYGKEGALAALKKLPTYAVEQILQSAPSMAGPLAVGAAATPFTGPIGGALAGIGAYGLQQFGQFMQRQAQEAKTAEELQPGKAAAAAAVTAPLGFFVDRLTLGMSKVPTKALGENIVAELAKRSGKTVAGRVAGGATIGAVAEAPTEVLEQMAERWQAGLPLFDEAAKKEYKEAAAGAAVVGGTLGGASRVRAPKEAPPSVTPPSAKPSPRVDQTLQEQQKAVEEVEADLEKQIQDALKDMDVREEPEAVVEEPEPTEIEPPPEVAPLIQEELRSEAAELEAPAVEPPFEEAPTAVEPEAPEALPVAEQPPTLDESDVTPAKGRHPQVQAAAKLFQQGKMPREEFEKYVDYYRPIEVIEADKLFPPSTDEQMIGAIRGEAKKKLNAPVADGTRVGLRMDLPAREKGVPVVSIHEGKPNEDPKTGLPYKSAGKAISYGSTGYLKDVTFAPRDQEKNLIMGIEPKKEPLQTVEGTWVNMPPDQVFARVKELMTDPAWTQVGLDPQRHGYFYDRKTRQPVVSASEMLQVGNFLLAKDVQFAPKERFKYSLRSPKTTAFERKDGFESFDENYPTPESVVNGFNRGDLLVHARTKDDTDFRYGIEPSIGEFVKSTESYQSMIDEYGEAPNLTFFSDNASDIDSWAKFFAKRGKPVQMVFVRKSDSMQKSLGGNKVMTSDGKMMSYEMSPLADYDDPLMRSEPAFVEKGDWYTNKDQDVVAVMDYAPTAAKYSLRSPKTTAFERWFGDSKVVDENGDPLVVYHGTNRSERNVALGVGADGVLGVDGVLSRRGDDTSIASFDTSTQASGLAGDERGFFFTDDPASAGKYATMRGSEGAYTMPVYLSIKNPLIADFMVTPNTTVPGPWRAALFKQARRQGNDGIIIKGMPDIGGDATQYVAFRPEQIKSATGNIGEFDPSNPDIRYSLRSPIGLFSALTKGIESGQMKVATADGWKNAIKGLLNKGAVKADEVEWTGIEDWLNLQQGKITKDQVLEYLKQGGVKVEEVVLEGKDQKPMPLYDVIDFEGGYAVTENGNVVERDFKSYGDAEDWINSRPEREEQVAAAEGPTKYGQYTLPGGENYREVLLTLPSKRPLLKEMSRAEYNAAIEKADREGISDYRSSHWDQPNVLAHIRINDRTDADGNRVLFVEEIQSDWGQEGKKKGFASEAQKSAYEKAAQQASDYAAGLRAKYGSAGKLAQEVTDAEKAEYERLSAAASALRVDRNALPTAPFVTKTEGWLNLALKRVMIMAAEGGYDKVAFVTGEQSADRYDLSKQVNRVAYIDGKNLVASDLDGRLIIDKEVPAENIEDYVGKEVARKLLEQPDRKNYKGRPFKELSGLDLKVGGEGMKAFYDKIVPTALKKLLPKVGGGQMGEVDIGTSVTRRIMDPENPDYQPLVQPAFDVTPAMREKVAEGLPLFSQRKEKGSVKAFEEELRKQLNKFGLKDVGVSLVKGMQEEGSYAQQLIRVAADAADPTRVLRHETIHALRQLGFFTESQWGALSRMAKDKWIDQYLKQRNIDGKPLKAGEESRYDAYMREYNGDMEAITEEAVADAFAEVKPVGMMGAIIKRLKNLFSAIRSALTKVESPEQIFGKIERGELTAHLAKDVKYAPKEQFFYSLSPISVGGEPSTRKPSIKRTIKTLRRRHDAGKIGDEQFIDGVNRALDLDESLRLAEKPTDRERGPLWIRQRLLQAVRQGDISEEAADFAEWFIKQNPSLAEDLGISVTGKGPEGAGGQYVPLSRVIQLIKERGNDQTVVHEILHHLERMMPAVVQRAIRKAWLKSMLKASREATDPATRLYYTALLDFHFRDGNVDLDTLPPELRKIYFDTIAKMDVEGPNVSGRDLAHKLLTTGAVDISHYQHFNPSEFWAVNASEIMKGRFDAVRGGVLARLKNWLKELGQKIKGLFGLQSNAPLISALDSLMKGDGKFVSKEMLAEGDTFAQIGKNIYNRRPTVNWTTPTDTKLDNFIYTLQDKQVDTKRVVQEIERAAGGIEDRWNPYLQEELYHGRTATATKDFLRSEVRPLIEEIQKAGVSIGELETYLHNRFAPIRNENIAKINPNLPDGGSGIFTEDAEAYMNALPPADRAKLERLAKMVDGITQGTRDYLVGSGLEDQDTINSWESSSPNYVPLNREDVEYSSSVGTGTGQGYSVRGSSTRRAYGSLRDVSDILANVIMQRERAIVRGEKNRVAVALYGLAAQNPNPEFWLAVNPDAKGSKKGAINELIDMGMTKDDAEGLMQEPASRAIDPQTGLVVKRINPVLRGANNVLALRVNGKDRFVFFNTKNQRAERMVTALKNLDADQLGRIMTITAAATRYFSQINTQYNPVFGIYNFLRDFQGGAIQLSGTPIEDARTEVLSPKNLAGAMNGIYSTLRAERDNKPQLMTPWSELWIEFQRQGGQTGYRDMFSRSEERAKALESELKKLQESDGKKAALAAPRAVLGWLADYNETLENAVRLTAYKAALDKGLSKEQAASVAKNLTVNFNRKGQISTQAGALYSFFNSSVQGTSRLLGTVVKLEKPGDIKSLRLSSIGKKVVYGGLLLGASQAMMLAAFGFGDDEPPDFVKDRNVIIPIGEGKYLAWPVPLGYHVIPAIGRIITEWGISGFKDTPKRVTHLLGLLMEAFNPIGNSGLSVQTISPTLFDPLVALFENRDWTGKKIAKEDFNKLDPTPGYTRAKENASWLGKEMSYFLNLISGGDKDKPGAFSPTPDQIDYLIGQTTGGVGREILKATKTAEATYTGEELAPYNIPLLGRFYGDTKAGYAESQRFYKNLEDLNVLENQLTGRQKRGESTAELVRDNPKVRLIKSAHQIERNIQQLKKQRDALIEKDAPRDQVKAKENLMTLQMKVLNEKVKALEK